MKVDRMNVRFCNVAKASERQKIFRVYKQKLLSQWWHCKNKGQMLKALGCVEEWVDKNFEMFYSNKNLRKKFTNTKDVVRMRI